MTDEDIEAVERFAETVAELHGGGGLICLDADDARAVARAAILAMQARQPAPAMEGRNCPICRKLECPHDPTPTPAEALPECPICLGPCQREALHIDYDDYGGDN